MTLIQTQGVIQKARGNFILASTLNIVMLSHLLYWRFVIYFSVELALCSQCCQKHYESTNKQYMILQKVISKG